MCFDFVECHRASAMNLAAGWPEKPRPGVPKELFRVKTNGSEQLEGNGFLL
jgi:hypothetical protein